MLNLVIALAVQAYHRLPPDRWFRELLNSRTAKVLLAKAPQYKQPIVAINGSGHQNSGAASGARDAKTVVLDIDQGPAVDAKYHVFDLLECGKTEEAYAYISTFRDSHPDLDIFIDSTVIDCELLSGHYKEAYADSIRYIRGHTGPGKSIGEDTYLQLSVAAAGLGQIFDGEEEYCAQWLNGDFAEIWNHTRKLGSALKIGRTQEAMLLSTLSAAVSSPNQQAYLDLCLKLDPTNDVAGRYLVQFDQWQGRYSHLRRVAAMMLTRSTDEASRSFYRDKVVAVEHLADRPRYRLDRRRPAKP